MEPENFIYAYGKFYDISSKSFSDNPLIVYVGVEGLSVPISSLEGVFVAENPLQITTLCPRSQMQDFEEKYCGKFRKFPSPSN